MTTLSELGFKLRKEIFRNRSGNNLVVLNQEGADYLNTQYPKCPSKEDPLLNFSPGNPVKIRRGMPEDMLDMASGEVYGNRFGSTDPYASCEPEGSYTVRLFHIQKDDFFDPPKNPSKPPRK